MFWSSGPRSLNCLVQLIASRFAFSNEFVLKSSTSDHFQHIFFTFEVALGSGGEVREKLD